MGAKDCCLMGLRKKRCGANWNEGLGYDVYKLEDEVWKVYELALMSWLPFLLPLLNGFARFNTTITSLKAPDEGFSSKNYVRKFLRALHPKWRAKDSEICKGKKERFKSIALKAKKEFSDDETLTFGSDDEEYTMAVRNFK
ncbi:hypothetical protein Tco_1053666 [Tanacetum coccineum]|uniref:UBN2 domain-containing protein n=1 Tax=Tanacetum coccineum TaxID=301880 RepID=A0ABQ5GVH2_9ASTR